MGRTHAIHGFIAGLTAGQLGGANAPTTLVLGMLGAGAAIAPDLDHPNATASKSLGPISWAASAGIRAISRRVYAATKTRYDRPNANGHRGITHTWPGALALGAFFGGGCGLAELFGGPSAGRWAIIVVLWLFLVWALRGLPPVGRWVNTVLRLPLVWALRGLPPAGWWTTIALRLFLVWVLRGLPPRGSRVQDYLTATVLTVVAFRVLVATYPTGLPVLLGGTIAMGAYAHAIGDSLTDYGAPLAFPLVIGGQRWYPCGPPKPLRFKAGKTVENLLVFPASLLGAVTVLVWLMGAWPRIAHAVSVAL